MLPATAVRTETTAERRKERLRVRIIEEATKLYHENGGENGGFEKTMVEAIAERSDIALRTFFRYFESKTDVIFLDTKRAVSDLENFMKIRLCKEPPVQAAINARFDQLRWFMETPTGRERLLRSLRAPQFQDRLMVLRCNSRLSVAQLLVKYFGDDPESALVLAQITASIVVDTVADALDGWAIDQKIDVEAAALKAIKFLPQIAAELVTAHKKRSAKISKSRR